MIGPDTESRQQGRSENTEYYEIRLRGHLDSGWYEWFEGMALTNVESGETILSGPLRDQAALHGVLNKIRDLGLPLLSVKRLPPDENDELER